MNQELASFGFNGCQVRMFPTDDGLSLWAVAKDVADILGYVTVTDPLRKIPERHKGTRLVSTLGGMQRMLCVDEAGLYRLVLRSDKPEAEPFMEWVTAEVLPSIRKTGGYSMKGMESEVAKLRDEIASLRGMLAPQKPDARETDKWLADFFHILWDLQLARKQWRGFTCRELLELSSANAALRAHLVRMGGQDVRAMGCAMRSLNNTACSGLKLKGKPGAGNTAYMWRVVEV